MTPALAEEVAAAAVVKRVAAKYTRAALLPSLAPNCLEAETLACWALITGIFRPATAGAKDGGIDMSLELSSGAAPAPPEMA